MCIIVKNEGITGRHKLRTDAEFSCSAELGLIQPFTSKGLLPQRTPVSADAQWGIRRCREEDEAVERESY